MQLARTSAQPPAKLSVVIASVNGWPLLEKTLRSIDELPERDDIEIIVVDAVGGETRRRLEEHEPAVVLLPVEVKLPIPRLRFLGVQASRAGQIAILEDHTTVDAEWAAAILSARDEPWGAIGGPIENGRRGFVNWAVFLCEYARYLTPLAEGETDDLPGNNIAFKRPHLMKHAQLLDEGKWESWINGRLRADGVPIAATNRQIVRHIKPFRLVNSLIQRFHFARSYAGMRRGAQSWPKRLVYAAGSAALPLILYVRTARTLVAKRRHARRLIACTPLLALLFATGAVGEMIGYLFGSGASLERVE